MSENQSQANENHAVLLVLFWAYVLIPMAWGVYQTLKKALVLFA